MNFDALLGERVTKRQERLRQKLIVEISGYANISKLWENSEGNTI